MGTSKNYPVLHRWLVGSGTIIHSETWSSSDPSTAILRIPFRNNGVPLSFPKTRAFNTIFNGIPNEQHAASTFSFNIFSLCANSSTFNLITNRKEKWSMSMHRIKKRRKRKLFINDKLPQAILLLHQIDNATICIVIPHDQRRCYLLSFRMHTRVPWHWKVYVISEIYRDSECVDRFSNKFRQVDKRVFPITRERMYNVLPVVQLQEAQMSIYVAVSLWLYHNVIVFSEPASTAEVYVMFYRHI